MEKMKGEPLETIKIFSQKRKLKILNKVTVPKNVKKGPSGFLNIHFVAKLTVGHSVQFQTNIFGESLIVPKKNPSEKHQDSQSGSLVCFEIRDVGCFGRGSEVLSMF